MEVFSINFVDINKKLSYRRGRAMLRVCLLSASTYLQSSFLLLSIAASDLLVHKILLNSVLLPPIVSVRGFPSEYRHPVWYGKTRMVGLRDGEKILKTCLFVLT